MKPPSPEEIDRVYIWAMDGDAQGSRYPGMTYEDGIINWLHGTDPAPDLDSEEL